MSVRDMTRKIERFNSLSNSRLIEWVMKEKVAKKWLNTMSPCKGGRVIIHSSSKEEYRTTDMTTEDHQ